MPVSAGYGPWRTVSGGTGACLRRSVFETRSRSRIHGFCYG